MSINKLMRLRNGYVIIPPTPPPPPRMIEMRNTHDADFVVVFVKRKTKIQLLIVVYSFDQGRRERYCAIEDTQTK